MDRYRLIPIILLLSSLLVLAIMFFIRLSGEGAPTAPEAIATEEPGEGGEVTPSPNPTETPLPTETDIPEPTSTIYVPTHTLDPDDPANAPPEGCNVAGFITDVTAPDNTEVDRKVKFMKTWRLKNDGTCTWNDDYTIYFYSGDQLGGPKSQELTSVEVPPGATIDVSVLLTAPKDPGKYKGYWAFKDPNGFHFGISRYGNPIYVKIIVK
jgi:hypothetical protein